MLLAASLVGCSSKPKQVEDARKPAVEVHDASPVPVAPSDAPVETTPTTGDVQIRVEWATMPLAARVSPGTSACATPLAGQVAPTTTWGIPEVVVFVDGAPHGPPDSRVVVSPCAIRPRLAIGAHLEIASAADKPVRVSLAKRFASANAMAKLDAKPQHVMLPIAGHEVAATLEPDGIYRVWLDEKRSDDAWIVGVTAAITDASGVALVKDVLPGTHAVRAWLPPRGGQPAREAKGIVEVAAGDLAELTLKLD